MNVFESINLLYFLLIFSSKYRSQKKKSVILLSFNITEEVLSVSIELLQIVIVVNYV